MSFYVDLHAPHRHIGAEHGMHLPHRGVDDRHVLDEHVAAAVRLDELRAEIRPLGVSMADALNIRARLQPHVDRAASEISFVFKHIDEREQKREIAEELIRMGHRLLDELYPDRPAFVPMPENESIDEPATWADGTPLPPKNGSHAP